jgi:hypothetical protein
MCTAPLPTLLAWTCKERIEARDLMLEEWAALMAAGDPAEHAVPVAATGSDRGEQTMPTATIAVPASVSPDARASAE